MNTLLSLIIITPLLILLIKSEQVEIEFVSSEIKDEETDSELDFDSDLIDLNDSEIIPEATLYKCSNEEPSSFLSLPKSLQINYREAKLLYFKDYYDTDDLFNFTLIEREPSCNTEGSFLLNISTSEFNWSQNPSFNFTPDSWLGYYNKHTGTKVVRKEIYYHPKNYCILRINEDFIQVKICKSRCYIEKNEKGSTLCIPKCCPLDEVMTSRTSDTNCRPAYESNWMPQIYSNLSEISLDPQSYPNFQLNYREEHWTCPANSTIHGHLNRSDDNFRVLTSGEIYERSLKNLDNKWIQISDAELENDAHPNYCIDGYWKKNEDEFFYDPKSSHHVLSICIDQDDVQYQTKPYIWFAQTVTGICLIASLIHLLIILVYGSLIMDRNQNVYSWSIFCLALTNFLLNILMVGFYGAFGFGNIVEVTKALAGHLQPLCIILGIMHHFLLISCFSWTFVISFDVWTKLRSMTTSSSRGQKKFLSYCCVGFGIPGLVVLIGALMEFAVEPSDKLVIPEYADDTCFISHERGFTFYICTIITPIFIINGILAILTIKFILDSKKNIKQHKDSASSSKFNKGWVVIKLFMLMGVLFTFELILGYTNPANDPETFIFFEFYRILNAVGSFWIFVWNDKTRIQLSQKYSFMQRYPIIPRPQRTATFNMSTKETPSKLSGSMRSSH